MAADRRAGTNPGSPNTTPLKRQIQTNHADSRTKNQFNEILSTGKLRFRPLAVPGALQIQQVGPAEVATIHQD